MAARKATASFSKLLMKEVPRWGAMKQTGVTLRYMMEFGSRSTEKNRMISARFLQRELPIRIARRAIELENLPYGLSEKSAVLKISDEGGVIPRSGLPKIFTYLYSTAENPLNELIADGTIDGVTMASYGYGLPISRLYAQYFGGDLQILSMEGYGMDAYLHLCRLGDSQEPLP